jgi:hypothetical protein
MTSLVIYFTLVVISPVWVGELGGAGCGGADMGGRVEVEGVSMDRARDGKEEREGRRSKSGKEKQNLHQG